MAKKVFIRTRSCLDIKATLVSLCYILRSRRRMYMGYVIIWHKLIFYSLSFYDFI